MRKVQLMIIGSGPAGLSAAIYAGRAGIETEVLGCRPKFAGDYIIDNYYGFPEDISGKELQDRGIRQAARFGAEIRCEKVLGVHQSEDGTFVATTEDREIASDALILATGVSRTRPAISNLTDYEGRGVSYCVSCDGFFVRNRKVLVVGEGIFAANQALELLTYTSDITLCLNGKKSAIAPRYMKELENANIPILEGRIDRLEGDTGLTHVVLKDGTRQEAFALFVAIGEASSTDFAYTLGLEREGVFISTDREMRTNVPGVFAAGDCTGGFLQIAKAVGEGAVAARSAKKFLKKEK